MTLDRSAERKSKNKLLFPYFLSRLRSLNRIVNFIVGNLERAYIRRSLRRMHRTKGYFQTDCLAPPFIINLNQGRPLLVEILFYSLPFLSPLDFSKSFEIENEILVWEAKADTYL